MPPWSKTMKWNKREKILLLVSILLLVVLVSKTLFYDGYVPQTKEEELAIAKVHEVLKDSSMIKNKVVGMKKVSEETKQEQKIELGYMVTLRKYLLGIIPVGESRVLV